MKTKILILSLATLLTACIESQSPTDPVVAKQQITEKWNAFIEKWEAEDANACAAFYSDNGINIPPERKILKGRNKIEKFYTFLFDNNLASKYSHTITQFDVLGDRAMELGEFKVDWTSNDSTTWTFNARSITHWKKNITGDWEIEIFMFNNPPEE